MNMGNKSRKTFTVNFDGGYARNSLHILIRLYRLEHKDPQARIRLEEHIEVNYPEEFKKFKEYEHIIEERTPNIKQMYFDYLDGKREHPEFEYFLTEWLKFFCLLWMFSMQIIKTTINLISY